MVLALGIENDLFPYSKQSQEGFGGETSSFVKVIQLGTDTETFINFQDFTPDGLILGRLHGIEFLEIEGDFTAVGSIQSDTSFASPSYVLSPAKTSYLSIPASAFTTVFPDVDDILITNPHSEQDGYHEFIASQNGKQPMAPVFLPNGVIVTAVKVYGNAGATAEDWELNRVTLTDASATTMATAKVGTEDTTITNATIDNSTYAYALTLDNLDSTDILFGARITYTYDSL